MDEARIFFQQGVVMNSVILIGGLLVIGKLMYDKVHEYVNVIPIVSSEDGRMYVVRNTGKTDQEAADSLAMLNMKNTAFIKYLISHESEYPDKCKNYISRLRKRYSESHIREAAATSGSTSYSINKKNIHFCVRSRDPTESVYDSNLLFYVSLHEMSHLASDSEGHTPEFYDIFKFFISQAIRAHLWKFIDFKETPVDYCGMLLQT